MVKEYWITNSRFKYIGLILLIIWIGFMVFFYLKADEITKNPCLICSEKLGENVICTSGINEGLIPIKRIYYENGTIKDIIPEVEREIKTSEVNFTEFRKSLEVNLNVS